MKSILDMTGTPLWSLQIEIFVIFFTDGIMISTGSNGRQENTNDDDLHLYGSDTSNTKIGLLVGLLVAVIILMWLLLLDAFVTVSEKSSK